MKLMDEIFGEDNFAAQFVIKSNPLPDGLSGMTKVLPALAQQEAIFVGEGAALPARIKIHDLPPDKLPRSETVSFAEGWSGDRLSKAEIVKVTARMDGSAVV
jgi:hypothetical protein